MKAIIDTKEGAVFQINSDSELYLEQLEVEKTDIDLPDMIRNDNSDNYEEKRE